MTAAHTGQCYCESGFSKRVDEMTSARVYICDSSECLQVGLTSILQETKFVVVGGAKSAEQALADIPSMHPDILVVDSWLPGINGSKFVTQILAVQPTMRILVLTDDARTEVVSDLLAAGASGYCLKRQFVTTDYDGDF